MVGEGLRPSSNFLLDTGIIIRYLRKNRRAADLFDYLEGRGEISVSVITFMEILVGTRSQEEEDKSSLLFDRFSPVIVSREVAQKAASLIRKYPAVFGKDNPRGFPDALIAATAWQQGSALITLNIQHFAKVPIEEFSVQAINQNAGDWTGTLGT